MSLRREIWKNKKNGGRFKKSGKRFTLKDSGCGWDCHICHGRQGVLEYENWLMPKGKPKIKYSEKELIKFHEGGEL